MTDADYNERWNQATREYARDLFGRVDRSLPSSEQAAQFSAHLQADADAGDGRALALRTWLVRRVSTSYRADRAFGSAPEIVAAFESGDFQKWLETQLRLENQG